MPNPDELIAILDRILNGSRDESEVAQLRQWLKVSGTTLQFVSQDGKFNTNIGQVQGGEIHIGDRHYQFDVEALRELLQPTTHAPNIDWHAVSQAMLEQQLRLTTNPLTSGEGISYRTEQVYVPLGLVERKRQTRRGEDVSPEQGSLLYEETEITQRFEHEQFLERVLRQGQSPKSRGKRIAIIGEPGAGKTTLLQQIAQWVSKQGEGAIAIWVSLADLRGQELELYLLERWLQAVARKLGRAEASPQVKDAFVAQFQQGRVWLLLDGVDEMQVSSGNPLAEMSRQVRMGGLLSQARIVLSCRLNLWDGNRNALDTFDTYRTLAFSYPQQVEQFIGQWFGALPEEQGSRLCAALKTPGKERIRDLVKNPLRLTLLCFNWYLGEGTLPETKAGLYKQFVADFYEWKREQFPTTAEQCRLLNVALGELAREAIDKEKTRFRLRHDFVCEFLGEPDEPDSLFQLALQLGWLNKVGVDAENPRKAVYGFFHTTFQEYFAASAINDCHFLFRHIPENPSHTDASYRIFEPQWKEVFLLWLGIEKDTEEQKKSLLEILVGFEDICGKGGSDEISHRSFYGYRAYFLAAAGIAEFGKCSLAESILEKIIDWSFGYLDYEKLIWRTFPKPLADSARAIMQETERRRAIEEIIKLLNKHHRIEYIQQNATEILGKIGTSNETAIATLKKIISSVKDEKIGCQVAVSLLEISPGNQQAVDALINLLCSSRDWFIWRQAQQSLEKISDDKSYAINALIKRLSNSHPNSQCCFHAISTLGKIGTADRVAIDALTELLHDPQHILNQRRIIESLVQIDPDNRDATRVLNELLLSKRHCLFAALQFLKINPENSEALSILIEQLKNSQDEETWDIIRLVANLNITVPDTLNVLKKFLHTAQDEWTRYHAAWSVLQIENNNPEAIATLVNLLDYKNHKEVRRAAAETLGKAQLGNSNAIKTLLELLRDSWHEYACHEVVESLGEVGVGNLEVIKILTNLLCVHQNDTILWRTAKNLKRVIQDELCLDVVTDLKNYLTDRVRQTNFYRYEACYDVIWYCAQNMTYPAFYEAWDN